MALDKFGPNAFATGSVTSDALATGTIATEDIADGAVTSAKALNLGKRNFLINGDMFITQRGASFTGGTSQFYTLDRWLAAVGSAFNFDVTVTQSNTVPSGGGFKHSLKFESNSVQTPTGNHNAGISQRLEGQNFYRLNWGSSDAKDLTLSFWVRSSKTGTYTIQIQQNIGAGNSTVYSHVKEYTINAANTWEKKIITFPGNTVQAQNQSTGDGIRVNWWLVGGSSDYTTADTWEQNAAYLTTSNTVNWMDTSGATFYLTGCQLESGSAATDFEHLMEAETLHLCQRYFQSVSRYGGYVGSARLSTYIYANVALPVVMRAAPTLIDNGPLTIIGDNGYTQSSVGSSISGGFPDAVRVQLSNFTGLGIGNCYVANGGGAADGSDAAFYFDAEL